MRAAVPRPPVTMARRALRSSHRWRSAGNHVAEKCSHVAGGEILYRPMPQKGNDVPLNTAPVAVDLDAFFSLPRRVMSCPEPALARYSRHRVGNRQCGAILDPLFRRIGAAGNQGQFDTRLLARLSGVRARRSGHGRPPAASCFVPILDQKRLRSARLHGSPKLRNSSSHRNTSREPGFWASTVRF